MYITYEKYKELGGVTLTKENADKYLKMASYQIDSMTFNRIKKIGFNNLTDFQKETVSVSVALQADFIFNNSDWIEGGLSQYSINGVSVNFGESKSLLTVNNILVPTMTFSILKQTGLCSLILR